MMQFGGRSNPSTWQDPGVGMQQYYTGQPVIDPKVHYAPARVEPAGCEQLYLEDWRKTWFSRDAQQCADVYSSASCPQGQQMFNNACGCGCEPKQRPIELMCSSNDRSAQCGLQVEPVCGVNRTAAIARRINFANACLACRDPNIDSYSNGAC